MSLKENRKKLFCGVVVTAYAIMCNRYYAIRIHLTIQVALGKKNYKYLGVAKVFQKTI